MSKLEWHSPYETPVGNGSLARRVLVFLERRHNPPAMNAPGKMAFGHRVIGPKGNSHWPEEGWFFDGQDQDYRVSAWAYADPPDGGTVNDSLNTIHDQAIDLDEGEGR